MFIVRNQINILHQNEKIFVMVNIYEIDWLPINCLENRISNFEKLYSNVVKSVDNNLFSTYKNIYL